MAQAGSRWTVTAEARFRARVDPCGICGGQSGTGAGFSPSSLVFPCQYHFHHCSIFIYRRPMRCAIAPTKHHIIIPSVLS
jgi:hypothetical protein